MEIDVLGVDILKLDIMALPRISDPENIWFTKDREAFCNFLISSELYRLANQFRKENADVVGDKPLKMMQGKCQGVMTQAEGLVRALPKASQC